MTLGDIERFCLSKAPEGCGAAALEDATHNAVTVTLFFHAHAQSPARIADFKVSRLQLEQAVNPHSILEILTHQAVQKLAA